MTRHLHARLPHLISLVLATGACVGHAQARPAPAALTPLSSLTGITPSSGAPSLTIQSPAQGGVVQGVAFIRFGTENVSIESPFLPAEARRGLLPAAHLHVSVDGAAWHWVHASPDPIVLTPLPVGEHTVELELAGADHRPLVTRTVRFTVVARTAAATGHPQHR